MDDLNKGIITQSFPFDLNLSDQPTHTLHQEMGKEIENAETRETWRSDSSRTVAVEDVPVTSVVEPKKPWWHPIKEPGSAAQIVISAVIAIAIGLVVTSTVDSVPVACSTILEIPGTTWLRALRATGEQRSLGNLVPISHELTIVT